MSITPALPHLSLTFFPPPHVSARPTGRCRCASRVAAYVGTRIASTRLQGGINTEMLAGRTGWACRESVISFIIQLESGCLHWGKGGEIDITWGELEVCGLSNVKALLTAAKGEKRQEAGHRCWRRWWNKRGAEKRAGKLLATALDLLLSFLEVAVVFVGKRCGLRLLQLLLVLSHQLGIYLHFRRCQGRCSGKFQAGVADELAGEPEEWLLKVVVALGRDLKVLQVLLAVERDGARLDFALLSRERMRSQWPAAPVCRPFPAALTFTSTLLPQRTMGTFSHTRTRSRCQLGTFLYVIRLVTSNMMIPHWP